MLYTFDNLVDLKGKTITIETNKAIDSKDLDELRNKAREAGKRFAKNVKPDPTDR